MGRPKKYETAASMARNVRKYFKSISRTVPLRERYPTGQKDGWGHDIYEWRNVNNDAGEQITKTDYAVPPSIGSLCLFLGISRQTWDNYCERDEFKSITTWAREIIESYLEEQLVTREKNVQGIIFNLTNNYGWHDKKEVDIGSTEKYNKLLNAIEEATGGGDN